MLAFTSAPDLKSLTSPVRTTRRTVLQKVRSPSYKEVPQLVDTGFQVLFHSPPGVLFTFPSQYYALSVTKKYLALRGGPRSFRQGFSCLVLLWILLSDLGFRIRGFHSLRPDFPVRSPILRLLSRSPNPAMHASRFGLFPFRSPLLWKSMFSFSSSGYLDVSVPRVPHVQLWIHCTLTEVSSAGFPHSDISGSMDMCSSPKLFAAYHVFHRLLVPRHPPCALTTLTVAGTIESCDSLFPH